MGSPSNEMNEKFVKEELLNFISDQSMDREELEWYPNIEIMGLGNSFENTVSSIGYKYGIVIQTQVIRLMLHYFGINHTHIYANRTYVSVPNQIILSGNIPVFEDYKWDGFYEFGGDIPIIDVIMTFYEGMGKDHKINI